MTPEEGCTEVVAHELELGDTEGQKRVSRQCWRRGKDRNTAPTHHGLQQVR